MASVEFSGARVTLTRVHDPADTGALAGVRRFLTDRPLRLELDVADATDLSHLYEAVAGREGALKDRSLTLGDPPPAGRRHREPSPSPLQEPTRADALRRLAALARAEIRSGALPLVYAGWAVALATMVGIGLGLTETTRQSTTMCSWDAAGWVLPVLFAGPPAAMVLIVLGTRRLRREEFEWHGWLGGFLVIVVALALYGGALLHATGRALC